MIMVGNGTGYIMLHNYCGFHQAGSAVVGDLLYFSFKRKHLNRPFTPLEETLNYTNKFLPWKIAKKEIGA